jgi:hypothetical protein
MVPQRTFGFGLVALKKFPELIPLVSILGVACAGATFYTIYSVTTKTDVVVNKGQEVPPWEKVNPETPQKFLTFNQKYQKIPELEELRKEIGSYKY